MATHVAVQGEGPLLAALPSDVIVKGCFEVIILPSFFASGTLSTWLNVALLLRTCMISDPTINFRSPYDIL